MPTILDLGQKVKIKYPGMYDDLSDYDVGSRVKVKYPGSYDDFTDIAPAVEREFAVPRRAGGTQENITRLRSEAVQAQQQAKTAQTPRAIFAQSLKGTGETIAASSIGLGKSIGKIFGAKTAPALDRLQQMQIDIIKQIRNRKITGGKTETLERLYNANLEQIKEYGGEIGDLPTTGQVVGQLIGTGVDVLSFGTYGRATGALKGLKTGVLGKAAPALLPAKGAQRFFSKPTAKELVTGAGIGYGTDVSLKLQAGEEKPFVPGLGTAIGVGVPLAGRGVPAVARFGQKAVTGLKPENVMQRVARISKGKQAKFAKTAKESIGEYLVKRGHYGNPEQISEGLYTRFTQSKKAADDALATLKGTYRARPIETALDDLLQRETKVSAPGALSRDLKRVMQLRNKYRASGLTHVEINEVKRLYERNVKLDYVRQQLPQSVARADNIDSAIRNWQFAQANKLGLKNLPAINREARLAKQLLDYIGEEYAGAKGNNWVSITDYILLAGGDPSVIGLFLTKKILSSRGIQSRVARLLAPKQSVPIPTGQFGKPKGDFGDFSRSLNPSPAALPALPQRTPTQGAPRTQKVGGISLPPTLLQKGRIFNRSQAAAEELSLPPVGEHAAVAAPARHALDDALGQAEMTISMELDSAQARARVFGEDGSVRGIKSTFPQWMSEELRSRKLFDKVKEYYDKGQRPPRFATKQNKLFDQILEETVARTPEPLQAEVYLELQARFSKQAGKELLAGIAGFERDEEGNFSFNPEKAALAVGIAAGIRSSAKLTELNKNAERLRHAIMVGERFGTHNKHSITQMRKGLAWLQGTINEVKKTPKNRGFVAVPGGKKTPIFGGYKDVTTKFLDYAKGKITLSRQEILDFARRPELKKGEADLLIKKLEEFPTYNKDVRDLIFGDLGKIGTIDKGTAPITSRVYKPKLPTEAEFVAEKARLKSLGRKASDLDVVSSLAGKSINQDVKTVVKNDIKIPVQEFADSIQRPARK